MNNSESWKWKNIKQKSVHPTSVCIFCEFCTKDKGSENWKHIYEHSLLCKKHPTQRTIHPITGSPTYAYWKHNQETIITENEAESCETEPTLELTEEEFRNCCYFNMDGNCKDFEKVDKKEEQKRLLSKGDKD
jgi:hypothetical protein